MFELEEDESEEQFRQAKAKYKALLVSQLYIIQSNGQKHPKEKDVYSNLTMQRAKSQKDLHQGSVRFSSSVGEPSSSEAELKNLMSNNQAGYQVKDLQFVPSKLLKFNSQTEGQSSALHEFESVNQFGPVNFSNRELLKQVVSHKRCISLQKSQAEAKSEFNTTVA